MKIQNALIDYATAVLGILGATLIPIFISLYIVTNLKFIKLQYLAMAGIGLAFWFFYDTMGNAAAVGVGDGFGGGLPHVGVVIVFLAGITVLAIIDRAAVPDTSVYESSDTQNCQQVLEINFLDSSRDGFRYGIAWLWRRMGFCLGCFECSNRISLGCLRWRNKRHSFLSFAQNARSC